MHGLMGLVNLLTFGVLKFVSVTGNSAEIADATTRSTNIASGTAFTLSSVASTAFSRPEDGGGYARENAF